MKIPNYSGASSWIRRIALAMLVLMLVPSLAGCGKYDVPEYVEIGPSETAFLVPLEGQTSNQKGFDSESYLKNLQVAAKRIQIPHRWNKTGRLPNQGEWIDTMRLIKVDRKAVVVEWSADDNDLTKGIKAESKESIAFAAGMTCAAMIEEGNAAKYLFWYGEKPLADVINQEIQGRIKKTFVQEAANYTLVDDELVKNKAAIMKKVEADVIPYFKNKGITITVLGLQGDLAYEQKVQSAINARFTAAQDRIAQEEVNTKVKEKATADAIAAKTLASTANLGNQVRIMQLENERMALENQAAAIGKWKGDSPQVLGAGQSFFNIPISPPKPASGK